jgi:hypothetical protein
MSFREPMVPLRLLTHLGGDLLSRALVSDVVGLWPVS